MTMEAAILRECSRVWTWTAIRIATTPAPVRGLAPGLARVPRQVLVLGAGRKTMSVLEAAEVTLTAMAMPTWMVQVERRLVLTRQTAAAEVTTAAVVTEATLQDVVGRAAMMMMTTLRGIAGRWVRNQSRACSRGARAPGVKVATAAWRTARLTRSHAHAGNARATTAVNSEVATVVGVVVVVAVAVGVALMVEAAVVVAVAVVVEVAVAALEGEVAAGAARAVAAVEHLAAVGAAAVAEVASLQA